MRMLSNRRSIVKAGLSSLGVAVFGIAASRTVTADTSDECDALFVLSARGMSFDGSVMTLHTPNPTVLYFCDRPVREAGHLTLEALNMG